MNSSVMSEHKWYVVRAVSGKERKVKEAIENEINRQGWKEFVPQILIPSEKVYEMRNKVCIMEIY